MVLFLNLSNTEHSISRICSNNTNPVCSEWTHTVQGRVLENQINQISSEHCARWCTTQFTSFFFSFLALLRLRFRPFWIRNDGYRKDSLLCHSNLHLETDLPHQALHSYYITELTQIYKIFFFFQKGGDFLYLAKYFGIKQVWALPNPERDVQIVTPDQPRQPRCPTCQVQAVGVR